MVFFSSRISLRSIYSRQMQLHICNGIFVVLGFGALGLSGSQFSAFSLSDYQRLDLRLLNIVHLFTGVLGFYSFAYNRGGAVLKSSLIVSLSVGIVTSGCFGNGIRKLWNSYDHLMELKGAAGFDEELGKHSETILGKIFVSSGVLFLGLVSAVLAILEFYILEKTLICPQRNLPMRAEERTERRIRRGNLMCSALLNFAVSLISFGCIVYVEYLHSGGPDSMHFPLELLAVFLSIGNAVGNLRTISGNSLLDIKMAMGLSLFSAVWSLKAIQSCSLTTAEDLRKYKHSNEMENSSNFVSVILDSSLIFFLFLLFCLNSLSSILGVISSGEFFPSSRQLTKEAVLQNRFLGIVHLGSALVLLVLGFVFGWTSILWISALCFSNGILFSSNMNVLCVLKFVLNVCSLSVSVEQLFLWIHSVADLLLRKVDSDGFVSNLVFSSALCFVFGCEVVASSAGLLLFGRHLVRNPLRFHQPSVNLSFLSYGIGALFYGITMSGCSIVFSLEYSDIPFRFSFYQFANGPFGLAVFVVQSFCGVYDQLLCSVIILQTVLIALAVFTLNSAVSNVFFIVSSFRRKDQIQQTLIESGDILTENANYLIILILSITATFTSVLAIIGGLLTILHSLKITHRQSISNQILQQRPATPIEEQTLYWMPDESPNVYKSTKRYLDGGHRFGFPLSERSSTISEADRSLGVALSANSLFRFPTF